MLSPTHVGNTTVDGPRSADIYYLRPHDVSEALTGLQADPTIGPLVGTPMAVAGHSFGGYTAFALAGATRGISALILLVVFGGKRGEQLAEEASR